MKDKQNPKSEARNSKQIQNTKSKTSRSESSAFGASNLQFVSDFEPQISDFLSSASRGRRAGHLGHFDLQFALGFQPILQVRPGRLAALHPFLIGPHADFLVRNLDLIGRTGGRR